MPTTSRYIPAIATQSLGRAYAGHSLETKLSAASRRGMKAIELFFEDLEAVATALPSVAESSWEDRLFSAADYIHHLCVKEDLDILCLQPFMQYEGLIDRNEHDQRIEKLHLWFAIADRLHTDLIQIPSNFLPKSQCTSDPSLIVKDMQEVADLGLQHQPHPIRFAHEALCWGTYTDLWEQAWAIVKAVDRPNFGTCLDTFNICGRIWGDPVAADGKNVDADDALRRSLQKMLVELRDHVDKIFYVEIVDAERLDQPLTPSHPWHVDGQKPRMSWSRNARLFPFEYDRGGYLPVLDVLSVITEQIGYEGYISFEYFNRSCNETGYLVPEEHARRAETSWSNLVDFMHWTETDGEMEKETEDPVDFSTSMKRTDSGVGTEPTSSTDEREKSDSRQIKESVLVAAQSRL